MRGGVANGLRWWSSIMSNAREYFEVAVDVVRERECVRRCQMVPDGLGLGSRMGGRWVTSLLFFVTFLKMKCPKFYTLQGPNAIMPGFSTRAYTAPPPGGSVRSPLAD